MGNEVDLEETINPKPIVNPRERVSLDRFPTTEAFLAHLENMRDTMKEEEKTPFTFVQPRDTETSNKDAQFNKAW